MEKWLRRIRGAVGMGLTWGAAWLGAGLLLSVIFALVVGLGGDAALLDNFAFLGPLFAVAGAGSAAGSLALARGAEEPERLEDGTDAVEAGLTEREARELPRGGG